MLLASECKYRGYYAKINFRRNQRALMMSFNKLKIYTRLFWFNSHLLFINDSWIAIHYFVAIMRFFGRMSFTKKKLSIYRWWWNESLKYLHGSAHGSNYLLSYVTRKEIPWNWDSSGVRFHHHVWPKNRVPSFH